MYQKRLARFERAALKHVMPHREEGFRYAGGLLQRQRWRHRKRADFGRRAVFCVTTARHQCHDLVAELVAADALAERHYFACDLETGNVACTGRRRIEAAPLRDV